MSDVALATKIATRMMGWSAGNSGFWLDSEGERTAFKVATAPGEIHAGGFFRPDEHYASLKVALDAIEQRFGVLHTTEWKGEEATFCFKGEKTTVKCKGRVFIDTNESLAQAALAFWENEGEI